jgi:hypothetical protein
MRRNKLWEENQDKRMYKRQNGIKVKFLLCLIRYCIMEANSLFHASAALASFKRAIDTH